MTSNIDPTKPQHGKAYTANVRANFQAALDEIEFLQSHDVTTTNPVETLYVKGDDTTDGSLRFSPSETNSGAIKAELRTASVWDRTAFDIASSTLHLGHDLSLGSSGEWLRTFSVLHGLNSLVPHVHFTDELGTNQLHSPLVSLKFTREPIQFQFGGMASGTVLSDSISMNHRAIYSSIYLKGGTIAATEPVTVELRRDSPVGDVFFKRSYNQSLFTSGKMGDITSVTDPSSSGAITTVTDNGSGLAVFHTNAPENLVVGSAVNIRSGIYLGTHFVSAVVSTTSFETGALFIGDSTSLYNSVEIDIHSVTHDLQNGDEIRVYGTTNYDANYIVYGVEADNFRVTRTYVTDQTGGWISSADILIDLKGDVSSDAGDIWYASLTSAAPISVATDAVGKWWFANDLQLSDTVGVNLDNQLFTAEAGVIINDEANYVISHRFQLGTYNID